MKLSEKDLRQFFDLMLPLLYYVNAKGDVVKNVQSYNDFMNCPFFQKKKIRDYLFEHIDIIDEFIEDNADRFDKNEIDILLSWKHFVFGDFIIERLLGKYAVFIAKGTVYAVLALQESFRAVLADKPMPMYAKTVLLPFKGQIVYDGFLEPYGVSFGGGAKDIVKDTYRNAKESGTIIHDLLAAPPQVEKMPTEKIGKELSGLIFELQAVGQNLEGGQLSVVEANEIINLLKATVQYSVQRFSPENNYEVAEKQFKKVKQAFSRIEKGRMTRES